MNWLLLPNQLFYDIKYKKCKIVLYEHNTYFTKYKYHKLRLIYHRATMKKYESELKKHNTVRYESFKTKLNDVLKSFANQKLNIYNPIDFDIEDEITKLCKKHKIELIVHDNPLFILTDNDAEEYLNSTDKLFNAGFYIWCRKKYNILVTSDKKPLGGKWSYDKENRSPFPKDFNKDTKFKINKSQYVLEAKKYVEKYFSDNLGDTELFLPIDNLESKKHFDKFLKERLKNFGKYEDAFKSDVSFGYHSVISPMLNCGILSVKYVLDKTIDYYKKHKATVNLQSVEGFIRQILSWREYQRVVYLKYHEEFNKKNFFKHKRKIPNEWYTGKTGIPPIDDCIEKVLKHSYVHHIERLMVLGNFMMLLEFDPKEVYKWFISLISLDSYEWVMEGNIYGMSQHSVGDLIMTRPYFSSSNYIEKMGLYKRKPNIYDKIKVKNNEYEWYEIWDVLYYNFIYKNKDYLKSNYSTATSVAHWNRKKQSEKDKIIKLAKDYLD